MPRIRKKTSNRQATRDRAKITKKVAEHKKKSKRGSKRDVTWKSKKKADPGIPNSFHFKDQVLAEMANEKRRGVEAKAAAKEAARRARGEASDDEDTPGISSLLSSVLPREPLTGVAPLPVEEDEEVPDLLDSDLPTLQAALDAADILLEVVDARDIQGGRSAHVESLVTESEGKVWLVINKADLVPREALEGWLKVLDMPAYVISAKEGLGCAELLNALTSAAKGKKDEFKVALLGLPNVGKSAVVNALLGTDKFKVCPQALASSSKHPAPTTLACAEAELPGGVRVIDTPGWEYVEEDDSDDEADEEDDDEEGDTKMDEDDEEEGEEDEAKWDALEARVAGDLLRRNLGRVDKVKDVFPLVNYIFSRCNQQDLMLKYNVPYFPAGDLQAFLTGLARVNGRVKTRGDPDHDGAARMVLRDWATSSFPYYTVAPKDVVSTIEQVDNASVLAQLKTRKEMRASGLIKFQPSNVDVREIFLDDDYTAVESELPSDDDEEEMDGFTDADFAGFAENGDEDEDDEDEDEDDDEGSFLGEDEGDELELESGPEPSSPSSLEGEELDSDDKEAEEEPAPPSRKRKAPSSPADVRKKAKTVSFNSKPEPKSARREVREVKSILKAKPKSPKAAQAPLPEKVVKKAKVAEPKQKKAPKTAPNAKADSAAKPAPKVTAKSKAAAAATDAGFEAYDFSKHF